MISMRILIVEDDPNICILFRSIIGEIASLVEQTGSLRQAMKMCLEKSFDVIILDLSLLDSNREETMSAIPEMKRQSGASIVVVTGAPDKDIVEQITKAGGDYCIPKGQDFSKMEKAILMALHAAILKHPRPHPDDDYLHHVAMLERLVKAA